MSVRKTCGNCRHCMDYDGDRFRDPWVELPNSAHTDWLRDAVGICASHPDEPWPVMLGSTEAVMLCGGDEWEEGNWWTSVSL